jgi:hypothetical protein
VFEPEESVRGFQLFAVFSYRVKRRPTPTADDHVLRARRNNAALKPGAYLAARRHTIELPADVPALGNNGWAGSPHRTARRSSGFHANVKSMQVNEMISVVGQYDCALILLLRPKAERQAARHDDEEPDEDTCDRFIRRGGYPVRSLAVDRS